MKCKGRHTSNVGYSLLKNNFCARSLSYKAYKDTKLNPKLLLYTKKNSLQICNFLRFFLLGENVVLKILYNRANYDQGKQHQILYHQKKSSQKNIQVKTKTSHSKLAVTKQSHALILIFLWFYYVKYEVLQVKMTVDGKLGSILNNH